MSEIKLNAGFGRHFEYYVPPKVTGRVAVFENGARLEVAADGTVDLTWACGTQVARRLAVPAVTLADGSAPNWVFAGVSTDINRVVVSYASAGGSKLQWLFKVGHVTLDGRKYLGFADAVVVTGAAREVNFLAQISPGVPQKLRRMTVAAGYVEEPAQVAAAHTWKPFENGQPFTYVVGDKGIYAGMPTGVEDLTLTVSGGVQAVKEVRRVVLASGTGETQFWWRWFGAGTENGTADYLGRWQYVRQFLRRRYALKEWPAQPALANCVQEKAAPSYARLGELRAQQAQGKRVIAAGMNPLVLDGADLSAHDFSAAPFALIGGAWKAVRGVDAFTAAAFGAFPRNGGALDASVAEKVRAALRLCVMPIIRETPFGTVWTGKDGGAIFFLCDVDDVDLVLPQGWTICGVKGSRLKQVKAGSVFVVESHYFG